MLLPKFISHVEVEPGDTIAFTFDGTPAFVDVDGKERPRRPPPTVVYEVTSVSRTVQKRLDGTIGGMTVVYGKSFGTEGERTRGWDLIPYDDRGVLLIARKGVASA